MQSNKIYKDIDIKDNALKSKTIAIIGFGNQGRAQALNLKDSKLNVIIGLRKESKNIKLAKLDGFKVCSIEEAVLNSDLICLLIPDEEIELLFNATIKKYLTKGQSILFSHGYSVFFKKIKIPDFVNIILVAPSGSGKMVREEFVNGFGVPNLVAIEQDYSKDALGIALSYSKAIGGTRSGAFLSTFEEEVVTDIFGEQVVLTGGIPSIIRESFNVLLEEGYSPIVAWFVCYYEVKSIVDTFHAEGFDFLNRSISNIAEYGGITRGERLIDGNIKNKMKNILSEIKSGKFKDEWESEKQKGFKLLNKKRKIIKKSKIEEIGSKILPLIRKEK